MPFTLCDNPDVEHPGFPCNHPVQDDVVCYGHENPYDPDDEPSVCEGRCLWAPRPVDHMAHHTARFHRAAWADSFATLIKGEGWRARNVTRLKGNVVEFDAPQYVGEKDWSHWGDWALTVSSQGSPDNPGVLDGMRCPPTY